MAGNYRFAMDQKDIVRFLTTTVGSFIQDRLLDREQRTQQKEQCAERLAADDGSSGKDKEIRYSDQAVLANLDWGIDALEEAINTSNIETKLARLDYAEKMLQVCAMLNSSHKTAGVPNFYLSAWAHLNLSYMWKLRNNVHNAVLHVLEMFNVDPFFSRIDFAPELWKTLFLPHMSSVVGWYSEERHRLVMDVIPDSSDLSVTVDFDQFFNESLVFSMRPDQTEKLQKLEQVYGQSLDENTRLYAKYYKDCLNFDSATSKKVIPMLPIVEAPMTPLHEVSRSIPDYVRFGPILPKSAGFSPVLKSRDNGREASRLSVTSTCSQNLEESATWDPQEGLPEDNEDDSVKEHDACEGSENGSRKLVSMSNFIKNMDEESGSNIQPKKGNSQMHSPTIFPPMESPKTRSPYISSPKPEMHHKKESSTSMLRLLSTRAMDFTISSSPVTPQLHYDSSVSSEDSDGEMPDLQKSSSKNIGHAHSMSYANVTSQTIENSYLNEFDEGSHSCISLPLSEKLTPQSRPPKDFVCPITSQFFCDPVTLETGQTYERKAIQEWMKRGNTTCPITRQPLSATALPKTNYVLKRLITSWKEKHPDLAQDYSSSETPRSSISSPSREILSGSTLSRAFSPSYHRGRDESSNNKNRRFMRAVVSTSPTSVISQAALETMINGLKLYVTCLCTSEDLHECEAAVLTIARVWKDSKADPGLHSYLSKPTIINGFVEILSASLNREVLRASVYILSELIFADDRISETLTRVDSDFDCFATLLKNGLAEAAVLIYLSRPAFSQLSSHDIIPSLVQLILTNNEELDDLRLVMEPKDAAVAILEQLLVGGDENSRSLNALSVISANGIPALIKCLDSVEGRQSVVSILLCCIHVDRGCKHLIATRIEFSLVLELFHAGNDSVRGICIEFLSELVQLNRRTLCNQVLQIIKDEGAFSTMHTLLVYLQMAPMEQQPAVATLLLQLDLLVEPRKMSIYREEAIEALIEALRRKDFPNCQVMAFDTLLSLSGRLTPSGKPYTEAWLLKIAGFDQQYNALMRAERPKTHENELTETMEEEEKAASSWEKRVAFVLSNHEKGAIFKALEECFKNNSIEMAKSCLVMSTWLTHMLYSFPDIGIRDIARKAFLDQFINVLQSSKNLEEKILVTLALKSFITDPGALIDLGAYAKCMYKNLRKLKRNSTMINDILKALMNLPSIDPTELWWCAEVAELDSCTNGEVLCLLHLKGCIISSHSDGTIKVWDAGKRVPRLIQEVREHTKAVTCLYVSSSCDKLYSGSLDKTIRVWAIKQEEIHCLQVHDVKDGVLELTANSNVACFSTHGTGVKVYNWSGVPKHVNFNKNVKSLVMTGNKLYCGCSGYCIQEVDLCKYTSSVFYSGARKLLGKQTIYSLHIHNGLLFAGGSSVDGIAGKVFALSTKAVIGSLSTGYDIHCIAVNNDFIFTATKCGVIEVWLKERVTKVATMKMACGGHAKITSLTSDSNGEMLFAGSSEGKIQAWGLD
ncbi:putative E3 ubiquitin-protein ligase LIN-1 [Actinidia eriantha]|uniref:putative E3 ubiquitin-protein ligase LIN-1 n=1 Tax=Actinidia eriantha TaxID=165200 RepID=UPI00258EEC48|nr:putative E3 ubiquitin-protein ligase LIN-1 [Actinidia eriantha]